MCSIVFGVCVRRRRTPTECMRREYRSAKACDLLLDVLHMVLSKHKQAGGGGALEVAVAGTNHWSEHHGDRWYTGEVRAPKVIRNKS